MTSGGRELVKWLALLLMTGDHVNKVLLGGGYPLLTDLGRAAMPLFAIVLVYNLQAVGEGATVRAYRRLLIAGLLVQPFHALAFGGWMPLNILFSLALGIYVASTPRLALALLAWFAGGMLVDFGGSVPFLMLAACVWFRRPEHWWSVVLVVLAFAYTCAWNGNGWALLALPLLLLGGVDVPVPRWRWAFLGYYVVHLVVLAALASV